MDSGKRREVPGGVEVRSSHFLNLTEWIFVPDLNDTDVFPRLTQAMCDARGHTRRRTFAKGGLMASAGDAKRVTRAHARLSVCKELGFESRYRFLFGILNLCDSLRKVRHQTSLLVAVSR